MTQREYGKRRGVSQAAVSKAISKGRLKESVRNGRIIDPDLADREWNRNSDWTDAPQRAPDLVAESTPVAEPAPTRDVSIGEASAAEKHWKAKLAELKFKQEAGELIPARDVEREWIDVLTRVKTKLLGIPSRAKQGLPHLSVPDVAAIEALVREALEEIADDR
jgi:hypothetical protein